MKASKRIPHNDMHTFRTCTGRYILVLLVGKLMEDYYCLVCKCNSNIGHQFRKKRCAEVNVNMIRMVQRRRSFLRSADRFQSARMTILKAIGAAQKGSGLRDQGRPAIATWCSRFVISSDKSQPTSLFVSKAKAVETLEGGL